MWKREYRILIMLVISGGNMKYVFLGTFLLVCGCSSTHMMAAKSYPSVLPEEVTVVFNEFPPCDYEEIAMINTPYSWNSNWALKRARKKAAQVGADYLKVMDVETNEDNDAKIEAIAYKCLEYYDE